MNQLSIAAATTSRYSGVICHRYGTVELSNGVDELFLQGDDATRFIDEYGLLVKKYPNMGFSEILAYLASNYFN